MFILNFLLYKVKRIIRRVKVLKIGKKDYKYNLKRKHAFMFTKILGVLKIEPNLKEITNISDILIIVSIIKEALLNFECAEKETLEFISAIYEIEQKEVEELGLINELKLWNHLFEDKELISFFSNVFKSKLKKKLT